MTAMVTKDGDYWEPDSAQVIQWQRAYPDIDVYRELDAAACWVDANPSKRKTLRGMPRFCNSWLKRAQDKGGSPGVQQQLAERGTVIRSRDMTMEDMMSRDWAK
jgi:hypothetical protein